MTEAPAHQRASYVIHVVSVENHEGFRQDRLDFIQLFDKVLDLFDTEPRFQHFTLAGQTFLLEYYLSIRPEHFERIEQLVREGRLLIGPCYIRNSPSLGGIEAIIRNLMIGLRTAQAFGPSMLVGYFPISRESAYLPQILKSFEINVAVAEFPTQPRQLEATEFIWEGIDRTRVLLGTYLPVRDESPLEAVRETSGPYSATGHLLALSYWDAAEPGDITQQLLSDLPAVQVKTHDSVFHSNLNAYAKALETYAMSHSLPIMRSTEAASWANEAEREITWKLEPLLAWADSLEPLGDDYHIRQPQLLVQRLWKTFLENQEQTFLEKAGEELDALAWRALADIARRVNTKLLTEAGPLNLVAFNPTDQPVTEAIQVGEQSFTMDDVPPFGYKVQAIPSNQYRETMRYENLSTERLLAVLTDKQDGPLPVSASIVAASSADFHISAIKLPEDSDREGMIVRGYNAGREDLIVNLVPWRAFKAAEVLTMDEAATGGNLAVEADGSIQFRAAPHYILTLWLHD